MSILFDALVNTIRLLTLAFTLCFISGCQEDLAPSNDPLSDTSSAVVGSTIDDFSYTLSTADTEFVSSRLQASDAVVLYFTMWCPVCDSHMQHIRQHFVNQYPNIDFIFIDYISGSVTYSRRAQTSSGYADFSVVADIDDDLQTALSGTMATTVVIDKNFIIKMNEVFKTGQQLSTVLDAIINE
jgi:peroxiredoxin